MVLLGAACIDEGTPLPGVDHSNVTHVHSSVVDVQGNTPTDPGAELYEARERNPVLAPDGRVITLGEFDAVSGHATVSCVEEGTQITLQMRGLVPSGVYTIVNATFDSPVSDTLLNVTGRGMVGTANGAESTLQASATGEGSISAITPAGPLSLVGTIGKCALRGARELHIVGVYHIDGATYGPGLGPDGTAVEQFAFVFTKTTLPPGCARPHLIDCEPMLGTP